MENNKHLVRVGHEFAAAMSDDTPIITIAKMITELASALDVQTARSEALAAENAALKSWAQKRAVIDDASEQENYTSLKIDWRQRLLRYIETPATDAFLAEVRAQGVEMFASKCKEESKHAHSSDARDSWWVSGENADDFAAQLRGNSNGGAL